MSYRSYHKYDNHSGYGIQQSELARAINEDPSGAVCKWCGGINDFYDDIGWFYFHGTKPGCSKCWEGEPGKSHREKYGVGDR